jgi:AcrR family transcriptional regulator
VVEALMELVNEGELLPSAEAVATRAGVGLRTVFRLFKDKDSLMQSMSGEIFKGLSSLTAGPLIGETWREKLDDMIQRRIMAYEQVGQFLRASYLQAHRSPFVSAQQKRLRDTLRASLAAVLPDRVSSDIATLDVLDLALSIDTWVRLRFDRELSPERTRATVMKIVETALAPFGDMP